MAPWQLCLPPVLVLQSTFCPHSERLVHEKGHFFSPGRAGVPRAQEALWDVHVYTHHFRAATEHVVIIPTFCPDCPYELRCPVTLHTSSFYLQTLPTAKFLNSACSPSSCILDVDSRIKSSKLVSAIQERCQPGLYKTLVQNNQTRASRSLLLWSAAATRLSRLRVPTLAGLEGSLILLHPLTSCLFDGNCCPSSVATFPCLATGPFTVWPS